MSDHTDYRIRLRRVLDAARCVALGQFVHHGMVTAEDVAGVERLSRWLGTHPDAIPPEGQ